MQTFDFDNIQEGDIAILHGIRGVYVLYRD